MIAKIQEICRENWRKLELRVYGQPLSKHEYSLRLYNLWLFAVKPFLRLTVKVTEWADRVAELRRKLNLTQVEFAKIFGVTQAAVSRWESGTKAPSIENYIRMGNIAPKSDCRWFWEKAGVDVNRIVTLLGQQEETDAAEE